MIIEYNRMLKHCQQHYIVYKTELQKKWEHCSISKPGQLWLKKECPAPRVLRILTGHQLGSKAKMMTLQMENLQMDRMHFRTVLSSGFTNRIVVL